MEIKELNNLSKSYGFLRNLTLITLAGCLLSIIVIVSIYSSGKQELYNRFQEAISNERWILDQEGNVLSMSRKEQTNETKKLEAKNHIAMMYNFFYEFDPYENFEEKLNKGLGLANSDVGDKIVAVHDAQGTKNIVRMQEMHLYAILDSLIMEVTPNGIEGISYGRQRLRKKNGEGLRHMDFEFHISILDSRTAENPHGMVVDKWNLINAQPINIKNKR